MTEQEKLPRGKKKGVIIARTFKFFGFLKQLRHKSHAPMPAIFGGGFALIITLINNSKLWGVNPTFSR